MENIMKQFIKINPNDAKNQAAFSGEF